MASNQHRGNVDDALGELGHWLVVVLFRFQIDGEIHCACDLFVIQDTVTELPLDRHGLEIPGGLLKNEVGVGVGYGNGAGRGAFRPIEEGKPDAFTDQFSFFVAKNIFAGEKFCKHTVSLLFIDNCFFSCRALRACARRRLCIPRFQPHNPPLSAGNWRAARKCSEWFPALSAKPSG